MRGSGELEVVARQSVFEIFGIPSDDVYEIYSQIKMKYDPTDGFNMKPAEKYCRLTFTMNSRLN